MADYINSPQDGVIRRWDMKFIANVPGEENWDAYVAYRNSGGVLDDYLEVQVLTLQQRVVAGVQKRLDDFFSGRGYDGVLSACTYVASLVPKFASEGAYAVQSRDAHWASCYQILGEVEAGLRPLPTFEDVMAEMPVLAWPA